MSRGPAHIDDTAPPAQSGVHAGVAYSLWLPAGGARPRAGIVVLHGAGSRKENHRDFARAARAHGFAAVCIDLRGHGASVGPLDGRVIDDIAGTAALLRERAGTDRLPVALRGSSMGGYLALVAARAAAASAVVAICPASGEGLLRGLRAGRFDFDADADALASLLGTLDLAATVRDLDVPVLLFHADGDEQVPVEHSRTLARELQHPASRLVVAPGGNHRSIQHDAEMQALSLKFLDEALSAGR